VHVLIASADIWQFQGGVRSTFIVLALGNVDRELLVVSMVASEHLLVRASRVSLLSHERGP
jgi:hypothetical protein